MCHEVLQRLREDHRRFERLFQAIDEKCDRAEGGRAINPLRLRAIAAYLGECALPPHHALEDAIFAQIVRAYPRFQQDIYDLTEDHQMSKREFQIFTQAITSGDGHFVEPARSFVANERGHFIAEEEIIFPYAVKHLASEKWPAVENFAPKVSAPPAGSEFITDLIS